MDDIATPSVTAVDAHVRAALARTTIETEPASHAVVSGLLPEELYALLLDAIPPAEGFEFADRYKQNFDPTASTIAPERSRRVWGWFERDIIGGVVAPLLLEWFRPYIRAQLLELFGPAFADEAMSLRQHAFRSRLMLRRPGYRLDPHRDTKIATMTGLLYFARPGDSHEYGTELYRVEGDQSAPSMKTFYPEKHGGRCTLVRTVPFIRNSALCFLNAAGMAHAAHLPRKAALAERYAYQFYIGPPEPDLARLVLTMPPEQRARWTGINLPADAEY